MINKIGKRGQVTIFVIIAIFIFAVILTFITLRGSFSVVQIPSSLEPTYATFLSCIEQDTLTGISVLESQGGHIELPEFEAGSRYSPFSSQLNFLGNPIPYWYYVSGNNIAKEEVPSKSDMEKELETFIESRVRNCEFQDYRDQGFDISLGEPSAEVSIQDDEVTISLNLDFEIAKGEDSALVKNHKVVVDSGLGGLYESAREIYSEEQEKFFLEEYGIDTLRLYAPVDGTEITCSPLVWNADEVFDELQEAIEVNTLALGTDRRNDYFNVDLPLKRNQEVSFLNSKTWPHVFEVNPSDDNLLTASPVGNQPGLGLIGFCYVQYHFVYSVKYPVLVQVEDKRTEEVFQFPMAVVIEGNKPREALAGQAAENVDPELCEYKNTEFEIRTKDGKGEAVESEISYECFGQKCNIGQTENGLLKEDFPQCVNGYVLARTPGFRDARYLLSTVSSGSLEISLEKLYEKQVSLKVEGLAYNEEALITFFSGEDSKTIAYPSQRILELGEGQYNVEVYIFKESDVNIGATVTEQCIDVPRSNILGLFGLKEERCFDIEVPERIISNALSGGGRTEIFISETDLINSNRIEINVESFPEPETVEQIQDNYLLFESSEIEVTFS